MCHPKAMRLLDGLLFRADFRGEMDRGGGECLTIKFSDTEPKRACRGGLFDWVRTGRSSCGGGGWNATTLCSFSQPGQEKMRCGHDDPPRAPEEMATFGHATVPPGAAVLAQRWPSVLFPSMRLHQW